MSKTGTEARVFDLETDFQKAARRPGGIRRDQALKNASTNIEQIKPVFANLLNKEIDELLRAVPDARAVRMSDAAWIDAIDRCSARLVDAAATMGYPFVSFVASNLRAVCEAIREGAEFRPEVIACHVDALLLARLPKYKNMRPEDMPELSEGLRQMLASASGRKASAAG